MKLKVKIKNEYFKKVIDHYGSQKRLAEELGVTKQIVSMWYNSKTPIPLVHAIKIENITKGKFKYTKLLDEDTRCYLKKK